MSFQQLKFPRTQDAEFIKVLRKRVNNYFKTQNISRFGNAQMVIKTICMLALLFVPYILLLSGAVSNIWGIAAMWALMGFGKAGIGLSIMHDANHGAYSRNATVNKLLGYLMNALGGDASNWRIQHNILHHSYTNVHGADEDIDAGILLRFSPRQKHYGFHRLQHIYAWFFYGLMTILWITTKDFRQVFRYREMDLLKSQGRTFGGLLTEVAISKILYYVYMLVLPLLLLDIAWWQTVLVFLMMHFITGLTLGLVFQPAHVMHTAEFPEPDEEGNLENDWAVHQLLTTTNFAPKSRLLSWYVGGLNFQIEHHLFPNICHVHYRKISRIVRETAEEFGLPYYSCPTFVGAVWNHGKMLYRLGNPQVVR
jgi:linoleoyl-CoA desaturase